MKYIYEVKNRINEKTYYGQRTLPNGLTFETDSYRGSGLHLGRAYKKYGYENFEKKLLVIGDFSQGEINRFEKCIIRIMRLSNKAEYNIADGGQGNIGKEAYERGHQKIRGRKHTKEAIEKMREGQYRRVARGIRRIWTEEQKKKFSEERKGYTPISLPLCHTKEVIERRAQSQRGQIRPGATEGNKKRWASLTQEQKTENERKGWETRRLKKLEEQNKE